VYTIELPVMAESLMVETAAAAGIVPAPAEPRAAPVIAAEGPRRNKTALVVDDEESNAALVRRVLASAGYDVESTTLSRRALAMIERTGYDAVICDVKMPELSGPELYGRVCQIRPEMARRFIFITGDIDGEDTRQFLDQSQCSYFMKPFNLERLTSAVDMLTGSRSPDTIG
jgi:DNA-binding NtrC family response regulator